MSFIKDFKAFAMKGSVIDLAVAVIIGGAFGKIVSAMVDDIIMPLVGTVTGGKLFTDNFFVLKYAKAGDHYDTLEAAKKAGANVFAYGHFIQTIFDFLIIALFIFIAIQGIQAKHHVCYKGHPEYEQPRLFLLFQVHHQNPFFEGH